MTATPPAERDRLGVWCGWVLVGAAALTAPLAWLAPMGFAALVILVGVLCLPAIRLQPADRPVVLVLLLILAWASATTLWSPFQPKNLGTSTILKLGLQLPLYWAAICGARRATPVLARLALRVLAVGLALLGVLLIVEATTAGATYSFLSNTFYEPIRPDLAIRNLARATFVLAVLWPLAAVGARAAGLGWWLAAPMAVGLAIGARAFDADAPDFAVVLSLLAGLAVWWRPACAPRAMASKLAAFFLAAPLLVWAVRRFGDLPALEAAAPLSWAERMGYWSHAVDLIAQKPWFGWGLDASRTFSPLIQLHPHDGPLQIWLELGAVGAALAAGFWALTLLKLVRPGRDLIAAGAAGSAVAYLLFGAVSFGVWQEWWLGLGALAVAVNALAVRTRDAFAPVVAAQPST